MVELRFPAGQDDIVLLQVLKYRGKSNIVLSKPCIIKLF
jgi:hypothetical protein